jgi:type IV pilus assembly protein PilN
MKITVNLATRPFADLGPTIKRLRISMAVFAVVCIGLGVGLHLLHAKAQVARSRIQALENQITKVNQERQGYQAMMRQPDNAQVLQQANNLNGLFDQKAFSWTLAMEDLETVLPGGVQVTTLEPIRDEKTGQITLKLRVVGPRDKGLELVQNLERSRHFLHPVITGESIENNGGPGAALEPVSASNRVNFDLNADYNAATLGEHAPPEKAKPSDESDSTSTTPEPAHKAAVPAAGPGLRRPPFTGVSKPPYARPGATSQPAAPAPQSHPPAPHYPVPVPAHPAYNPQQKTTPGSSQQPVHPGGPQ